MPRCWHKILFCKCNKKIYIDKNITHTIHTNDTTTINDTINNEKFSNQLSKSIKDSFDSYLDKLNNNNIKN